MSIEVNIDPARVTTTTKVVRTTIKPATVTLTMDLDTARVLRWMVGNPSLMRIPIALSLVVQALVAPFGLAGLDVGTARHPKKRYMRINACETIEDLRVFYPGPADIEEEVSE